MSAPADAEPLLGTAGVLGRLSLIDRFLPVWIFAAMALGLLLGRHFPGLGAALDRVQVSGVGPLVEVPALVALVYVALWARRFFPAATPSTLLPAHAP